MGRDDDDEDDNEDDDNADVEDIRFNSHVN
jgi:hypothetical protein